MLSASRFCWLPLPVLVTESESLEEILEGFHGTLWVVLAIAALGHTAAALKHHFIDRDDILSRMLPGGADKTAYVHDLYARRLVCGDCALALGPLQLREIGLGAGLLISSRMAT